MARLRENIAGTLEGDPRLVLVAGLRRGDQGRADEIKRGRSPRPASRIISDPGVTSEGGAEALIEARSSSFTMKQGTARSKSGCPGSLSGPQGFAEARGISRGPPSRSEGHRQPTWSHHVPQAFLLFFSKQGPGCCTGHEGPRRCPLLNVLPLFSSFLEGANARGGATAIVNLTAPAHTERADSRLSVSRRRIREQAVL